MDVFLFLRLTCQLAFTPQIESVSPTTIATGSLKNKEGPASLGDFRTNSRMLVLVGLAIPIGIISALVAKVLLWLIAEITNLVFFQRFGDSLPSALSSSSWTLGHRSRRSRVRSSSG